MIHYLRITVYSLSLFLIFITVILSLDVFSESHPLKETLISFGIHLIPAILLIFTTVIGWKHKKENIAGLLFIIYAFSYYLFTNQEVKNSIGFLIIELPLIIIGLAYLVSLRYEKKLNMDRNQ